MIKNQDPTILNLISVERSFKRAPKHISREWQRWIAVLLLGVETEEDSFKIVSVVILGYKSQKWHSCFNKIKWTQDASWTWWCVVSNTKKYQYIKNIWALFNEVWIKTQNGQFSVLVSNWDYQVFVCVHCVLDLLMKEWNG
jgi:hypothetical protein